MANFNVKDIFYENIEILIENRDAILSRPSYRDALVPVNISAGRPGFGGSFLYKPTLGAMLRWWQECKESVHTDAEGVRRWIIGATKRTDLMTYFFYAVDSSGKIMRVTPEKSEDVWKTLCSTIRECAIDDDSPASSIGEVVNHFKSRQQ